MEIKITRRELDIILVCLSGATFENHQLQMEADVLRTKLIEERKGEYVD